VSAPAPSFCLGVLVSGNGTNLQAMLDAIAAGTHSARVGVVVSNVASAKALERAKSAKIPAIVVDHKAFPDRESFDSAVVEVLRSHGVECVVLAGFMRLITSTLLDAYPNRIVNVHPALLPSFPGTHAQRQALQYGVGLSGCTVHFVDAGVDTGPIIVQGMVPVLDDDDEASLSARILKKEHELLPLALQWIAEGKVTIEHPKDARPRARVRR
jgi:phosphoribosylglycinamide formyltransferase-1